MGDIARCSVGRSNDYYNEDLLAELFFNHSGTETFRDKLLKVILADSLQDGQEPEKTKITR